MKIYSLKSIEDNYSTLATIIEFEDNQVVVKWHGNIQSLVIHHSLKNFKEISVGKTRQLELIYNNCMCNNCLEQ